MAHETAPMTTSSLEKPKKSHRGLKITLAVIVLLLAAIGVAGFVVYQKAMAVVDILQADGAALAADGEALMTQVEAGDYAAAAATAESIRATAEHMRQTISTKEFDLASRIPIYGRDVLTARDMLDIVVDVDANAIIPLLQKLADVPLASLVSVKGGIDVAGIYSLLDTVDTTLTVAGEDIDRLAALPEFAIPQLAEAVGPMMDNLGLANEKMSAATASLTEARPFIDQFIGRDGKGAAVQLWPFLSLFLPDDTDLFSILKYMQSE